MPENERNFVVGSVSATDADSSSTLSYNLEYPSSLFSVDSNTGTIRTITPLDYETSTQHTFTVEVSDGGPTPRIGRALVTVNVLDRSDNVPIFTQRTYSADFEENRTGTLIRVNVSLYSHCARHITKSCLTLSMNFMRNREKYNVGNYTQNTCVCFVYEDIL